VAGFPWIPFSCVRLHCLLWSPDKTMQAYARKKTMQAYTRKKDNASVHTKKGSKENQPP